MARRCDDPDGTWASLNWITHRDVRRLAASFPGACVTFNPILLDMFARVVNDRKIATRTPLPVRLIAGTVVATRLHRVIGRLPLSMQPYMEVEIARGGWRTGPARQNDGGKIGRAT